MKKSNNYFLVIMFKYFLVSALRYTSISIMSSHVQVLLIRKHILAQLHLIVRIACENFCVQDIDCWNGEIDRKVISIIFLVFSGTSHSFKVEVKLISICILMQELSIKALEFTFQLFFFQCVVLSVSNLISCSLQKIGFHLFFHFFVTFFVWLDRWIFSFIVIFTRYG